jgi:predicted transcriptional regulator
MPLGDLTGKEIRKIRMLLGITQNEVATVFGGGWGYNTKSTKTYAKEFLFS